MPHLGACPVTRCAVAIACSSSKRADPCTARDLYTGRVHRAAQSICLHLGPPWGILSAQYGWLQPTDPVEPYDLTLADLGKAEREAWAERTAEQAIDALRWRGLVGSRIPLELVIVGGERYAAAGEAMRRRLPGLRVVRPLAGLGIGQQYSELKRLRIDYGHLRNVNSWEIASTILEHRWGLKLRRSFLPDPRWEPWPSPGQIDEILDNSPPHEEGAIPCATNSQTRTRRRRRRR